MMSESFDDFGVSIAFDVETPTVAVTGEVDMLTAPSLGGVLTALIDDGHRRLVVDLTGSRFVDARGVGVIADAGNRTRAAGGALVVRVSQGSTSRLLEITSAATGVEIETLPAHAAATSIATVRRSSTDLVDASLRLVTALAGATVEHADGVSVTLERHGQLMTVAATDDEVLTMDRHQYETGEGPCLEARSDDRWVYSESLADEVRWPAFTPLALGQGIHSIFSSPLKTHGRPQGALNMYSMTARAFGAQAQQLASLFAVQASEILTTAAHDTTEEDWNARFTAALGARRTIHQAQGVIMARSDASAEEAAGALLRDARSRGTTVLALAAEIVASLEVAPRHDETGRPPG